MAKQIIDEAVLFYEEQKPATLLIGAILILYSLYISFLTYLQVFKGIPFFGLNIPNNVMIALWILLSIATPVLFFISKLIIKVKPDGVYIKYFPFHQNFIKINPEDIKEFEAITYNPLKDYGGWGLRYGKTSNAFNSKGTKGVLLKLKYTKDILIGSQKTPELFEAIQKMIESLPQETEEQNDQTV